SGHPVTDMQPGQTIAGKYRLNQVLGTGGMASVWSATNVFTEREFAIKFMLPSLARTPEAAKRFLMEAKASARINHPNVTEVIDVGQAEDGALFLVMELLSGVSLETAMRRQNPPMTVHDFCLVMLDVARALSAAHKSNVIHRDLKPSNVFLHKDRHGIAVPKLLDFGVSKFLEEEGNSALTMAGTVLGSPMYMSPEQAMGASGIDGRTDIFAFGSILFEGLAGYRCFEAANFNALIVMIATQHPKNIDDCAPHMPEPLRALVRDCLVVDRKQRVGSFDEIVDRLGLLLPYLENDPLRLPSPRLLAPPSDPDATNALPAMMRPSDRPPGMGGQTGRGSASGIKVTAPRAQSGSYSQPWGAGTMPGMSAKFPLLPLALGAGAFALLVTVAVAFAIGFRWNAPARSTLATTSTVATTPASTSPTAEPTAESSGTTNDGVIDVDSLPVVPGAPKTVAAHGTGRLAVMATPGWCTLFVDGASKGATPTVLELASGPHQLRCDPPSGKPRLASVNVIEGGAARYRFSLE
ncbi:MAG: Serine/threonine protein kinase, partial [Myxococcaceae bacterium]|nr:Serine/threonine protein kinase [Myxococcaceae bacterium]